MKLFNSRAASVGAVCAAIVLSGGTGAYASAMIDGGDIKNESVTGSDVDNGTIGSPDIKNGSIDSIDIKDSTVTAGDMRQDTIQYIVDKAQGVKDTGITGYSAVENGEVEQNVFGDAGDYVLVLNAESTADTAIKVAVYNTASEFASCVLEPNAFGKATCSVTEPVAPGRLWVSATTADGTPTELSAVDLMIVKVG